ncbi:ParB N-terminal domain-containing protein [Kordiimonas sp.]|uniref:ParB N-terminal domain-containing protein n=1 Tax=Kordiimonas sp. TaxID=1970157 RepID=UPI003A8F4205
MLKTVPVRIDEIYVPTDRRKEINQSEIDTIVSAMMDDVPRKPVRVREGKGRYVLIEGVNRLEACKTVGDETVPAYIVQARKF